MTYTDIVTPIRKTIYGEADIIFTLLSAHHGRIESIAKGMRKSTSKKRGNIEFGAFSTLSFVGGYNLDIITEAQMIDYNEQILTQKGLKFIYNVMPTINKFSTDVPHCTKIFESLKEIYINFAEENALYYELLLKYELLNIQDLLPNLKKCFMCRVDYDYLDKYSTDSKYLICNNCARKVDSSIITVLTNKDDLLQLKEEEIEVFLNILNRQIKEVT